MRLWERLADSREPVWYCTTVLEHTHTKTIRCVSWSPAGAAIVTASFDGTAAVWRKGASEWGQVTPAILLSSEETDLPQLPIS